MLQQNLTKAERMDPIAKLRKSHCDVKFLPSWERALCEEDFQELPQIK